MKMIARIARLFSAPTAVFLIWTTTAFGAVPNEVSYQGLLLDDLGVPVTAAVAMEFELFDAPAGGTAIWFESHPAVQVVDGVYDVVLGQTVPITPALVAGGSLHLEITVEGETMTPRQALLAVPYALRSGVSESTEEVGGFSQDYFTELIQHVALDGGPPSNTDPREGLADVDGDGVANFVDADNDGDGLSDSAELGQGSDINLVTPQISGFSPATTDGYEMTTVQVQGAEFDPAMTVVFGSQTPTPSNVTPTSFDVLVGSQSEGVASVQVTLSNGETVLSSFSFFLLQPAISSFSPFEFAIGQAGTITVTGENFIAGMSVQFGSQSPASTNITPTSFDISVAGTEPGGVVPVTVTLPNGKSVLNDTGFEVITDRVIFVTSTTHDGNLGGLAGADAICQGRADAAGLAGTYHAWLADSTQSPNTRESKVGMPYVRTDGAVVADDWADLTDGTIDVAINLTESGGSISPPGRVWSGVAAVGAGAETANHCTDWTADAVVGGRRGDPNASDATWTQLGAGILCNTESHLYCIRQ